MDNAAFEENNGCQVADILRNLVRKVDGTDLNGGDSFVIKDVNGNTIGHMKIIGK
jgi:uncharacterized protein YxjI